MIKMPKYLFLLLTVFVVNGCASYKDSKEFKELENKYQAIDSELDECIKSNVRRYAKNVSATHTEVAEATVTSCSQHFSAMCSTIIQMHSLGISNKSARERWKLGKVEKCVSDTKKFMRDVLIRDLVEHRN